MEQLKINCEGSYNVKISELVDIQKEVKEMNPEALEKLSNSLKINGFCDPFCVWNDPNGEQVLIAGNQRLKALKHLQVKGILDVPESLPAVKVKAENRKEAIKILLSLASTFGEINKKELHSLISDSDLEFSIVESTTNFIELESSDSEVDITAEEEEEEKKELPEFQDKIIIYLKKHSSKDINLKILEAFKKADKKQIKLNDSVEELLDYLLTNFLRG